MMELQDLESSYGVGTSAGLCGLWQPEAFSQVAGLDSWEDEMADDSALIRHIGAGEFVPINVGGNGAFQIALRGRTSATVLSDEREAQYRLVPSEPYLLKSLGELELGGLESVGSYSGAPKIRIALAEGLYSVVFHLVDWKAEPGGADAAGKPTDNALPDFVVEISRELPPGSEYRTKVETFERP
jgi:hypothetical protein